MYPLQRIVQNFHLLGILLIAWALNVTGQWRDQNQGFWVRFTPVAADQFYYF